MKQTHVIIVSMIVALAAIFGPTQSAFAQTPKTYRVFLPSIEKPIPEVFPEWCGNYDDVNGDGMFTQGIDQQQPCPTITPFVCDTPTPTMTSTPTGTHPPTQTLTPTSTGTQPPTQTPTMTSTPCPGLPWCITATPPPVTQTMIPPPPSDTPRPVPSDTPTVLPSATNTLVPTALPTATATRFWPTLTPEATPTASSTPFPWWCPGPKDVLPMRDTDPAYDVLARHVVVGDICYYNKAGHRICLYDNERTSGLVVVFLSNQGIHAQYGADDSCLAYKGDGDEQAGLQKSVDELFVDIPACGGRPLMSEAEYFAADPDSPLECVTVKVVWIFDGGIIHTQTLTKGQVVDPVEPLPPLRMMYGLVK